MNHTSKRELALELELLHQEFQKSSSCQLLNGIELHLEPELALELKLERPAKWWSVKMPTEAETELCIQGGSRCSLSCPKIRLHYVPG